MNTKDIIISCILPITTIINEICADDSSDEEEIQSNRSDVQDNDYLQHICPMIEISQFTELFRMSLSTFTKLCGDLYSFRRTCGPGRTDMEIEKQILIVLTFYTSQESLG